MYKIKDIEVYVTAPEGINLVVVKVQTTELGLYGLGCSTFTQRYTSVVSIIKTYLKPFLIGKDVSDIEDIWNTAVVSGYWRNSSELNNALSGIDMALWDIKGKVANMPLYQLFGGKCRTAVPLYTHAEGNNLADLSENIYKLMEEGFRHIRCKMTSSMNDKYSIDPRSSNKPFHPKSYMRESVKMLEYLRREFDDKIELIHDVHERLTPTDAVTFAKCLEVFDLYFLEDVVPPEQIDWLNRIRNVTTTPIAIGELFTNPNEWLPLISQRLIDYIRIHISHIGGITPAKKIVSLCEAFGVRTAWHGPLDLSPIGHAANMHLNMNSINFGIQEWQDVSERTRNLFPGTPEVRHGCAYTNDLPGLGIDFNEIEAKKYPPNELLPAWTLMRLKDGTPIKP